LLEYLEDKTTTHEFADVDACLGADVSAWAWQYDPVDSMVTLKSGGSVAARVPTPIKVTHAANCGASMALQLNTTVPALSIGDINVAQTLTSLVAQVAILEAEARTSSEVRWFTSGACPSGWQAAPNYHGKALMIDSNSQGGQLVTNMGVSSTATSVSTSPAHAHAFTDDTVHVAGDYWNHWNQDMTIVASVSVTTTTTVTTTAPTGVYLLLCVKTNSGRR